MAIDKDILLANNNIYSPLTCIIVPQRINLIFLGKRSATRIHTGVRRYGKTYSATYNTRLLGYYDTPESAVEAHNSEKFGTF